MDMNFITQASESRSWPVTVQAKNIERYYPQSTHYIYDGGLNQDSKQRLSKFDNVEIIDWTSNADFLAHHGHFKNTLAKLEDKIKNAYSKYLLGEIGLGFYFSDILRWNFYIRQKPKTILDLSSKVDGKIVWLDDDAIPINKFDEVFNYDFDVGVTLRNKYDEKRHFGTSINSGVIFFHTDTSILENFVLRWLDLIERSTPTFENPHVEQDTLEKILLQCNPELVNEYYQSDYMKINETQVRMRTFPCENYNHINFECGINPEENKIVHFKGDKLGKEINKNLLRDIERNKIENWQR